MTTSSPSRGSGAWALVLASLLWGTTGTAASFFPDSVSPLAVGSSTMTVGGLLLFAASLRPALRAIRDATSRRWLLLGALGVFVYPLAFYSSMSLAGVAIGNVVSLGTGPVFAALLEWVVERHRPSTLWAACTAVAIAGIVLLSLGDESTDAPAIVPGVLLGLVAGLAYALYTFCSSRGIRAGQSSRGVMGGMFGLGAVALAPVLVVFGAPLLQSWQSVGIAAYLALGPMFVAYLLFGVGMRTLRSSTATTITLLEPVVATVLAIVVVGERLGGIGWLGLALILGAVTVLATARRPASGSLSP
ncbi:MAG: EamA family transporter [Salinibacterium sp.]|nr:EamA family transporter [Salinibacterium sp.]